VSSSPIILSLETATLGGSVFIGRGSERLAARLGDPEISHSNTLLSDINESLQEVGLTLTDVDLLACASGPGSFTGLRIGIATLKALAATLHKPCVGIPTLDAIAHSAGPSSATIALLPAGRGELFAQMFSVSNDGAVTAMDAASHLSPVKLVERYGTLRNITWAGRGAHGELDFLESYALDHGIHFTADDRGQASRSREAGWTIAAKAENLAKHVAALALYASQKNGLQSAESLKATYVRPSDAELKEQCR
jgi:tRNA threonylcarbamoyl adenosine modification protein YeaZ